MLRFRVGSTAVVLSLLSSCGARDALDVDGSSDVTSVGAAGPGPSTSPSSPASSGTGAGGTGAGAPCTNFVVDGEPYTIPAGQNATEPEVGVMPDGRLFVAWLAQSGALVGDATIDLDVWPHPFESISELAAPARAPIRLKAGSFRALVILGSTRSRWT
jgi:hypothetical protein